MTRIPLRVKAIEGLVAAAMTSQQIDNDSPGCG
jgi:hypothetical protein